MRGTEGVVVCFILKVKTMKLYVHFNQWILSSRGPEQISSEGSNSMNINYIASLIFVIVLLVGYMIYGATLHIVKLRMIFTWTRSCTSPHKWSIYAFQLDYYHPFCLLCIILASISKLQLTLLIQLHVIDLYSLFTQSTLSPTDSITSFLTGSLRASNSCT